MNKTIMNSDSALPAQDRLRWFWAAAIVCQVELITILLLFSVRSVWGFINGFIDRLTGLKEYAFIIIFSMLIVLFLISVFYLGSHIASKKPGKKQKSKKEQ